MCPLWVKDCQSRRAVICDDSVVGRSGTAKSRRAPAYDRRPSVSCGQWAQTTGQKTPTVSPVGYQSLQIADVDVAVAVAVGIGIPLGVALRTAPGYDQGLEIAHVDAVVTIDVARIVKGIDGLLQDVNPANEFLPHAVRVVTAWLASPFIVTDIEPASPCIVVVIGIAIAVVHVLKIAGARTNVEALVTRGLAGKGGKIDVIEPEYLQTNAKAIRIDTNVDCLAVDGHAERVVSHDHPHLGQRPELHGR